jgi:hypothetical protein
MSDKIRCPKCKHPLDADNDVTVVCVSDTATELKLDCYECFAVFSHWIDHTRDWSDEDGKPADLSVKKGGRS